MRPLPLVENATVAVASVDADTNVSAVAEGAVCCLSFHAGEALAEARKEGHPSEAAEKPRP